MTNWENLFGTPEQAANSLETVAKAIYEQPSGFDYSYLAGDVLCSLSDKCNGCPLHTKLPARCRRGDYYDLLEWLKQEVAR